MWHELCERISAETGRAVSYRDHRSVTGGCIHQAKLLETDHENFFVKINNADRLPLFEAEAKGLHALQTANRIRCPKVILNDVVGNQAVLVLEYITMQSAPPGGMEKLGKQLADLHQRSGESFGWLKDNFIGSTPQPNTFNQEWIPFFRDKRLLYQIQLAERNGLRVDGKQQLLDKLEFYFDDYAPFPSLLHGDLWGGNIGFDDQGEPVIYDPACYYGDREADLAFTEMFGGFSSAFYTSYNEEFPIHAGYKIRKNLYNLYHELNHYNLFGGGYGSQALITINYLLRE